MCFFLDSWLIFCLSIKIKPAQTPETVPHIQASNLTNSAGDQIISGSILHIHSLHVYHTCCPRHSPHRGCRVNRRPPALCSHLRCCRPPSPFLSVNPKKRQNTQRHRQIMMTRTHNPQPILCTPSCF